MSAFAPRIGGGMAKTTLNNTITMVSTEGVDLVDDGIFDSTLNKPSFPPAPGGAIITYYPWRGVGGRVTSIKRH